MLDLRSDDYSFLNSLDVYQLESLLSSHPTLSSKLQKTTESLSEAEADKARKEAKRAKLRDLKIPPPANVERRLKAETDPEMWLATYFSSQFGEAFTGDRKSMLRSIIDAALYGGDQAIAGPRGEGKTTIATRAALYLME